MCSLHLTHPRAHTLGPVGSQHSGARLVVRCLVQGSYLSRGIPAGAEIRTHNLRLQVQRSIH